MIGMISAVSKNGIIGQDNKIPFDYPADLKHFKNTTIGSTIIMGRRTFEGIGRPLPKRYNIVITSKAIEGITCTSSIDKAVLAASMAPLMERQHIWFIGGASIYQEGMKYADTIILTLTPDTIEGEGLVRFPFVNPSHFILDNIAPMEADTRLQIATYHRIR